MQEATCLRGSMDPLDPTLIRQHLKKMAPRILPCNCAFNGYIKTLHLSHYVLITTVCILLGRDVFYFGHQKFVINLLDYSKKQPREWMEN